MLDAVPFRELALVALGIEPVVKGVQGSGVFGHRLFEIGDLSGVFDGFLQGDGRAQMGKVGGCGEVGRQLFEIGAKGGFLRGDDGFDIGVGTQGDAAGGERVADG